MRRPWLIPLLSALGILLALASGLFSTSDPAAAVPSVPPSQSAPPVPDALSLPILLYHHIDASGEGESVIAQSVFLSHLDALAQAGYQTVTFQQLYDYVALGVPLPENPLVLTFDDGYLSNYEIAYPALKERGMVGTIFVIGSSVGRDTYKDSDTPITPHFSYEQAREMIEAGVMSIQTHTYDMHQYRPLEPDGGREGVLPRPEEPAGDYIQALRADLRRAVAELAENTGEEALALSYPFGLHTRESDVVAAELGFPITLTTVMEQARLVRGDLDSLLLLGRFSIDDCTPQALLEQIAPDDP